MKWFEYQMEVDEQHAPDELKARLLAMQPKPEPQPTPSVHEKPAQKGRTVRFPRWKQWAAGLAACAAVAFIGIQAVRLGGASLSMAGGAAASSTALYQVSPETSAYSLNMAADNSLEAGSARSLSGESAVAGDKIIYTASLTLETKDYDTARAALEQALTDAGGWMESSSESTRTNEARSLSLTLRVPEENYQSFLEAAGQAANLVRQNQQADDVTAQYTDVAGRIANLEGQRDRLRELQASAETLSDLLDIEAQLSDVQYQLESWQSQLDWYDDQIASCTVTVTLQEVEVYTSASDSLMDRLGAAFAEGWENFLRGLEAALLVLVGLWPVVVILAAAVVILLMVRTYRRRRG